MELHQYAYILKKYKNSDIPKVFKLTPLEMEVHELTSEQIDEEYHRIMTKTSDLPTKKRVMIQLLHIKNHKDDADKEGKD